MKNFALGFASGVLFMCVAVVFLAKMNAAQAEEMKVAPVKFACMRRMT